MINERGTYIEEGISTRTLVTIAIVVLTLAQLSFHFFIF
jgi:hypothetical protein